jgi:hypothetical protein
MPEWRQNLLEDRKLGPKEEDSTAKARKLAEQLRFRLKEAMAQHGGSEAFLHWLRSEGHKSG